ncbi:MAG: AraC family transcriptional regulator [Bacteroidota bacterium]
MNTLINIFNVLTGLLGLIMITIITIRFKSNRVINIYLLLIFFILSIKFLINGFIGLKIFLISNHFYSSYLPFLSIGIPSLYLYFKNLVADKKIFNKKELKHFIFPLFLGFCSVFLNKFHILSFSSSLIFSSLFIIFHLFYNLISFQFLKKNIWNRKADLHNIDRENNLLVKWTSFLFFFNCLLSARLLVSLFFGVINDTYSHGQHYIWISAILIHIIYLKILYNPKILYGYNALYKKIKNYRDSTFILRDFWILNPLESITNSQDIILKGKIEGQLSAYLHSIESLVLRYEILRNPKVSISDIANKLLIPKSHITFVFKYHSKVSFTEFKKIIRIYDALHLIEKNYLKSNTLESLAAKVGFSSYNPFFITFKDITGTTPQVYYKEQMNS